MSLPTIAQLEFNEQEITQAPEAQPAYRTLQWDFTEGDFVLKDGKTVEVDNKEYLKVWIKKSLLTIRSTLIYEDTEYGSEHHSLIGTNFNPAFTAAELKRMIREALLVNPAITTVSNFRFSQEKSRVKVEFDVGSIFGQVDGEVIF